MWVEVQNVWRPFSIYVSPSPIGFALLFPLSRCSILVFIRLYIASFLCVCLWICVSWCCCLLIIVVVAIVAHILTNEPPSVWCRSNVTGCAQPSWLWMVWCCITSLLASQLPSERCVCTLGGNANLFVYTYIDYYYMYISSAYVRSIYIYSILVDAIKVRTHIQTHRKQIDNPSARRVLHVLYSQTLNRRGLGRRYWLYRLVCQRVYTINSLIWSI